jgi:hypothetical protein
MDKPRDWITGKQLPNPLNKKKVTEEELEDIIVEPEDDVNFIEEFDNEDSLEEFIPFEDEPIFSESKEEGIIEED